MTGSTRGRAPRMSSDYERAGFGNLIGFGARPALVIVDMIRGYLDDSSPFWAPAYDRTLVANQRVLSAARAARVPTYFTTLDFDSLGEARPLSFLKMPTLAVYVERPELLTFDGRLAPEEGDTVLTKRYASGFFGTSLSESLTGLGVDTLVITGVSTSGCVRATAVDALQTGLRPIVVEEAVGDRAGDAHAQALYDLHAKYADVVSLDNLLQYFARV